MLGWMSYSSRSAAWTKRTASASSFTAGRAADVGGLVLLADLTIAVGHDVMRIGVDAEEAGDLSEDAGLLQAFPDRAFGGGLADILSAAGECPLAGVAAALQQDGAVLIHDE